MHYFYMFVADSLHHRQNSYENYQGIAPELWQVYHYQSKGTSVDGIC